jgi:hypothetical protein
MNEQLKETNNNQPPTAEAISEQIESTFDTLKTFSERVAHRNPIKVAQPKEFDRYRLAFEDGVQPVSSESLGFQPMTIIYSGPQNHDPENHITLKWPVPGGGTLSPDGGFRSNLTTDIVKSAEGGPRVTTVETVITPDSNSGLVQELSRRENDPEDISRLNKFLEAAPDRLVTADPLTPEEEAKFSEFADSVIKGMMGTLRRRPSGRKK